MFSCYANDKKNKNSMKKNISTTKEPKFSFLEDTISNNPDTLKKMDENSLVKLKTKLNIEYQNIVYENELNTNKINFYKKYIDHCKKNLNIEQRNELIKNEFIDMRNKFSEVNNEYLSLFDSLSSLTNRYSKVYQLSEKIHLLENKIKEQENTLQYINERSKYLSNHKNIEGYLSLDNFPKLFENRIDDNTCNSMEEKNSESSSSSSSSSSTDKKNKSLNTISNNADDIKKVNKFLTRNNVPRENIEDYKRMLAGIHKKNYELVSKDYQKVISETQHELLNKNTNLKKLELIKNDIEILKDPTKRNKIVDEEEKTNTENKNKEFERKNESQHQKKIFHEKKDEYDKLKINLEKLNNELSLEKEKYNQIQISLNLNNDNLNNKIKEGNEIEIKFDEIKNERNFLIEQIFGNLNINDNAIAKNINENKG